MGERLPLGFKVDQSIIDGINVQRKRRVGQLKQAGELAQGVLDRFNSKWTPAVWHEPRQVPEYVDEAPDSTKPGKEGRAPTP